MAMTVTTQTDFHFSPDEIRQILSEHIKHRHGVTIDPRLVVFNFWNSAADDDVYSGPSINRDSKPDIRFEGASAKVITRS